MGPGNQKAAVPAMDPTSAAKRPRPTAVAQPNAAPPDDASKNERASIRQRIHDLVGAMPLGEVQALYTRIEEDRVTDPVRMEAVKEAFIEHLNRFRPQRARRLFSELFVPLWVEDPILLRSPRPVPGLVQRVDVGALWAMLSPGPLAELTLAAQRLIDRLADGMLISDAVKTREARALLDRLRTVAAEALDQSLGSSTLGGFLDEINRRRQADARPLGGPNESLAPLDSSSLAFIRDYLKAKDICTTALAAPVLSPPPGRLTEAEAEREATALMDAEDQVRDALRGAGENSNLPFLLPLTLLHRSRRYLTVALYLRENSGFGSRGGPLSDSLLCHFASCCAALTMVTEGALRIDQRAPGAAIKFTRKERGMVDDIMNRLEDLILALILGGILESRVTQPVFQALWMETTGVITNRLALIAIQRVSAIVTARTQASHDHQDVAWLIGLIWTWHRLGRRYDFGDQTLFLRWRSRLMEDLKIGVDRATKFEQDDNTAERMDHLLRLDQIAVILDQKISPFLSVSSPGVIRIVMDTLSAEEPPTPQARKLIVEFLAMVRSELKKSPRWQSPELAGLIKLADAMTL